MFVTRFQQGADYKKITHDAQALFSQALAIDPNNADALAGSAFTYFVDYYYGWRPDITDSMSRYWVRQTGPFHSTRTTCRLTSRRLST